MNGSETVVPCIIVPLEYQPFDLCQGSDKLYSPNFIGCLSGVLDLTILLHTGICFVQN